MKITKRPTPEPAPLTFADLEVLSFFNLYPSGSVHDPAILMVIYTDGVASSAVQRVAVSFRNGQITKIRPETPVYRLKNVELIYSE